MSPRWTVDEFVDRVVAAVPDLAVLRAENAADGTGPHVLLGEVVGWCEDHVGERRADVAAVGRVVAQALELGDDRTRNLALVSFSEGIFPGTPLWDVVPVAVRDTWSGPAAGAAPGGPTGGGDTPVAVAYCERWDRVGHVAHLPLTEAQARERFERGPWFTVVLPLEPAPDAPPRPAGVAAAPDVVLEVEAGLTTVTAVFFDDDTGDVVAEYVFRRTGDTLRFAVGTAYEAPEDGGRGRTAVTQVQQVWLQPDGSCEVLVARRGSDEVELGATTVDVAAYTEPVPAFGDWAGLARYER